jgi:hypothetical protein
MNPSSLMWALRFPHYVLDRSREVVVKLHHPNHSRKSRVKQLFSVQNKNTKLKEKKRKKKED